MLDGGHDRVDRLCLDAAQPCGKMAGKEVQEHRVMRQAVIIELVVSRTLPPEA